MKGRTFLISGYKMKNTNNIFENTTPSKKRSDIKDIKNIGRNSGYLHEWKEEQKKRRISAFKKIGLFGGILILTASITIFINYQNVKDIWAEQERILASITPAPTQRVERPTEEPVVYSQELTEAIRKYEDTVGYLKIADTNMDFPIVQGEDNFFYENRNYDRSYSEVAATYMLTECDAETSRHIVIYGENVDAAGRLGELNKYLDYDFFHTHEFITLELLDGAQVWQVFSVHLSSITFDYKDIEFESNTEYLAYIRMFQTMSQFKRDVNLTEEDQILTLVTDYHDLDLDEGYLMIHARRIN